MKRGVSTIIIMLVFLITNASDCYYNTVSSIRAKFKEQAYKNPLKVFYGSLTEGKKIPVYKDMKGEHVIDSLENIVAGAEENFVVFIVDTCVGDMIYAQPIWSYGGQPVINRKVWARLSDGLIIDFFSYSPCIIPLFDTPSHHSNYKYLIEYAFDWERTEIKKIEGKWIYVRYKSEMVDQYIEGWLPPEFRCPNGPR